jgi:hypothetical protein
MLGAAGESIRRTRPDAVLLDSTLPPPVVRSCKNAADETGARVILTSSSSSRNELASEADGAHCTYFALPGGATELGAIIERALDDRRAPPSLELDLPHDAGATIHPALCAALASVARARVIAVRAQVVVKQSQHIRALLVDNPATRTHLDALRAAVSDYARQLRSSSISESDAIRRIRSAVTACAAVVGAEAVVPEVLRDSEDWARDAYRAA